MKARNLLAGLAWINVYALTWAIMFLHPIKSPGLVTFGWIFFLIVAIVSSTYRPDRTAKEASNGRKSQSS